MAKFVDVVGFSFRAALARELADVARTSAQALVAACGSGAILAGLYLAKSAAGINLMPGKSPLHELLFQFVR